MSSPHPLGTAPGPFADASAAAPAAPPGAARVQRRAGRASSFWDRPAIQPSSVRWTMLLIAFLTYIWTITTYSVPLGDVAMGAALLALPFQKGIRFPYLLGAFAVFLVWCAFGYTQSPYPGVVQDSLINFGKFWLITLVAVNALRTGAQIQFFMIFILGAFAMYPARGTIFNYVGGYTHFGRALWNHIYANPNDLAALTLLQLAIAAALLVSEKNRLIRFGAIASVIVLPVVILMTQSRGVLIALALFVVLTFPGQRRKLRSAAILGILGTIAILVAPGGVWERAKGLVHVSDTEHLEKVDEEGSAKQRFEIWRIGMGIHREHRLAGVGLGAYPNAHRAWVRGTNRSSIAGGQRDVHSTYLQVLTETGVIGFFLFLLIVGGVLLQAERVRRRLKRFSAPEGMRLLFLEVGLIGFLTAGIFASYAHLSHLYIFLALITVVTAEGRRKLEAAKAPAREAARRRRLGLNRGLPGAFRPGVRQA